MLHMNQDQPVQASEFCVFCSIASGAIPAYKVYEDEYTVAFLDQQPSHPGHTLVIPKDHFENLYTTPTELYCRMQMTVQKVAIAVRHAVDADGINIISNNEEAAGQKVFHTHIHIIPRHNDDGFQHWPHAPYKTVSEAETVQKNIQDALKE